MPTNERYIGRAYTENRVFARWSVQKLEQIFNVTLANYTGGKKTGVKGVPEKVSTRAENMDEPCLRAVER